MNYNTITFTLVYIGWENNRMSKIFDYQTELKEIYDKWHLDAVEESKEFCCINLCKHKDANHLCDNDEYIITQSGFKLGCSDSFHLVSLTQVTSCISNDLRENPNLSSFQS